jgi:hypothetical protein
MSLLASIAVAAAITALGILCEVLPRPQRQEPQRRRYVRRVGNTVVVWYADDEPEEQDESVEVSGGGGDWYGDLVGDAHRG